MTGQMFRRVILLTKSNLTFKKKLGIRASIRCHACLAGRQPPFYKHQEQHPRRVDPLSTPSITTMNLRHYTRQHDAVRDLLPDLLTSAELSGRSLALSEERTREICSYYLQLNDVKKAKFLLALSELCGVNHEDVSQAAVKISNSKAKGEPAVLQSEQRLLQSLTPGYRLLLTHIGRMNDGVKFLVDMRADILTFLSQQNLPSDHHMRALSSALKDMVVHWFSAGLLQLQTITWDSSCSMLQKISEYEAVHPVRGWADLKRRVGPYRRCFVYTHSTMPHEPVVVLHTALTDHIPSSIQSIVGGRRDQSTSEAPPAMEQSEDPGRIQAAIFYSISSTQKGLRGVDLGNHLIKHAVRMLQVDFPQLTMFSSLSPIPGFQSWLLAEISHHLRGENSTTLFTSEELGEVHSLSGRSDESEYTTVKRLLSTNQWTQSEKLVSALQHPLMRLCARYLYVEKHRKFALDSVANFHLRNGALMWRLNWMGDASPRGLTASCGMMVNYRYFLDGTTQNSRAYAEDQRISATQQIMALVNESKRVETKSSL